MLNGIQKKKKIGSKTECIMQILHNENTNHGGNDDQNWENKNTSNDHIKYGKRNMDDIQNPN